MRGKKNLNWRIWKIKVNYFVKTIIFLENSKVFIALYDLDKWVLFLDLLLLIIIIKVSGIGIGNFGNLEYRYRQELNFWYRYRLKFWYRYSPKLHTSLVTFQLSWKIRQTLLFFLTNLSIALQKMSRLMSMFDFGIQKSNV